MTTVIVIVIVLIVVAGIGYAVSKKLGNTPTSTPTVPLTPEEKAAQIKALQDKIAALKAKPQTPKIAAKIAKLQAKLAALQASTSAPVPPAAGAKT